MTGSASGSPKVLPLLHSPQGFLVLTAVCPLLAASSSATTALGMSVALSCVVLPGGVFSVWLHRNFDRRAAMWGSMMIFAGLVAAVELAMNAWFPGLHRGLGIFLPLSLTGCLLLAKTDSWLDAPKTSDALKRGVVISASFWSAALLLGAAREIIGRGSLFHDAGQMLGARAAPLGITLFRADMGFLLAVLVPGAFIALGLLTALYEWQRRRKGTSLKGTQGAQKSEQRYSSQ